MGSFYKVCGITGLTIRDNEPCYVTRLERQQHVYRSGDNVMEVDQEWQPISFPQITSYYDYGMVDEGFEPNPLNKFLGLNVSCDGEEKLKDPYFGEYRISDSLFLAHRSVYEQLSSIIIDPDLFGYRDEIYEQGPSYFVKAFEDAKEMSGDKIHRFSMYIETYHPFGWKTSKIGWKIINKMIKADSYEPLDKAVELGLADALYQQFIFETNMSQMWKYYRPSNYGGQYENRLTYEVLADLIKTVSAEKAEREEEWENE